ncbi:unnamed protein product [Larinioides sclopetarius]|uniref:Uncharacterized protein n=1 Tax=Larinioides sclopetarius TaxID=280406 RepID=A0AAV2BCM5_9ARAC
MLHSFNNCRIMSGCQVNKAEHHYRKSHTVIKVSLDFINNCIVMSDCRVSRAEHHYRKSHTVSTVSNYFINNCIIMSGYRVQTVSNRFLALQCKCKIHFYFTCRQTSAKYFEGMVQLSVTYSFMNQFQYQCLQIYAIWL